MVAMTQYSPHIQLLLSVWLTIWLAIWLLYAILFALYAWPTVQRWYRFVQAALYQHLHCVWCWRALHILRWYPWSWPSNLCSHHKRQARAQIVAQQARYSRYHAETRPAAPALRAKEVCK